MINLHVIEVQERLINYESKSRREKGNDDRVMPHES